MYKFGLSLALFFFSFFSLAQNIGGNINGSSTINAIDYCTSKLTLQSAFLFSVGDRILVIQTKGAQIDTTNGPSFGQITDFGAAGKYEFATIQAKTGSVVTLTNALVNEYTIGAGLMAVRVPVYANATVTTPLTCSNYNGTSGGIIALEVTGTLTLQANIDASGRGYRLNNSQPKDTCCAAYEYRYPISAGMAGTKGESFVTLPNSMTAGKGPLATGGGGGNMHNAGGGGGAHVGAGGQGGTASLIQFVNVLGTNGLGGVSVSYASQDRLFMGGGAGNGHDNNFNQYNQGGRGGGIVFIKAGNLISNGFSIIADGTEGQSDSTVYSDGLPGGGGGGLVFMDVATFTDTVRLSAKGGKGGSNLIPPINQVTDAAGGGGGGGALLFSSAAPTNLIKNVSGGAPGQHLFLGLLNTTTGGQPGLVYANKAVIKGTAPASAIPALAPQVSITPACEGDSVTLSAAFVDQAEYYWSGPAGWLDTGQVVGVGNLLPNQAGNYSVVANKAGCYSPPYQVSLQITPTVTTTSQAVICDNESYTLPNGSVVNAAGDYPVTLAAFNGCDSIATTQLTVNPTFSQSISDYFCEGESYTLSDGSVVNAGGNYTLVLTSILGCDSTLNYTITEQPTQLTTLQAEICDGETFTLANAQVVNTSGNYPITLSSVLGCDSIVTTQLTVWPLLSSSYSLNICSGDTYTLPNGTVVSAAGTYTSVLSDQHGCDSTVTTTLSLWALQTTELSDTICNGGSLTLPSGIVVTNAGTYTSVLSDQHGCDSTIINQLTVIPFFTTNLTPTICSNEPYTLPDGVETNQAGTYNFNLSAVNGCDSLVIVSLTVLPVPVATFYDTICPDETLSWLGTTLDSTGFYTDTLIATNGCDSIVHLDLYVVPIGVSLFGPDSLLLGDQALIVATPEPSNASIADVIWQITPEPSVPPCDLCLDFNYQPLENSNISVTLVSPQGCTATDMLDFAVNKDQLRMFFPNVFSPNDDQLNDLFKPLGGPELLLIKHFMVFDRWGNKIYDVSNLAPNDPSLGWNGTARNEPLVSGVYVYTVECVFIDGVSRRYSGDITILR